MSLSSLLEIWRSQPKIVSDENAARIHLNIISQAGHRIVYGYIDITLIENKKQKVLKCVVCNKMSFFNSISCGHVIFGCCYVRYFKLINYLQFNSYYTKCPGCMVTIKCSEAYTISQEIETPKIQSIFIF